MVNKMEQLESILPELIREMDAIKVRRETYLKATKARFNVFTVLRKAHEEVGLHTRFLSLMLDPEGSHDCGDLFLGLFIETLNEGVLSHAGENSSISELNDDLAKTFEKIEVERRHDCGQIDISLYFKEFILVIENKIDANEQEDQISRYNQRIKPSGKPGAVLFLSLDGKKSETAGEHENEYVRISYSHHILTWLEKCLEKTYQYPNINCSLQQYKNVIVGLTGKDHLSETNMQDIEKLVHKNPRIIKYAESIKACVDEIKRRIEDKLWQLIKKEIEKKGISLHSQEVRFVSDGTNLTYMYIGPVFTAEEFKNKQLFVIEKAEFTSIYCGIILKEFNSNETKTIQNKFGDVFEQIRLYLEKERFSCDASNWNKNFPIGGTMPLFEMNDDWFIELCGVEHDAKLQAIAEEISKQIKAYIDLVMSEWKKNIGSR